MLDLLIIFVVVFSDTAHDCHLITLLCVLLQIHRSGIPGNAVYKLCQWISILVNTIPDGQREAREVSAFLTFAIFLAFNILC